MNIDDYTTMFNNLNAALAVANAEGDSVLEQKLLDAVNHMLHGMPTPTKDLAKLHIYQPTRRIDVDRFAQLLSIPVLYAYEYRIHGQQTRDEVEMWFPHDMRACMAYELSVYLDLDSHNIWFVWVFTPSHDDGTDGDPTYIFDCVQYHEPLVREYCDRNNLSFDDTEYYINAVDGIDSWE